MSKAVKELDRALSAGSTPSDDELAAMVGLGNEIRNAFTSFTPGHSPQRALFVGAVSEHGARPGWSRFLAPATVTAALLICVLFLGRSALPGETFYPVREVLRNVGLAPASVEEVQALISDADDLLDRAEAVEDKSPEAAERFAFEATRIIGMAEAAFADLDVQDRPEVVADLNQVIARAKAILTEAPSEDKDRDADGKPVRGEKEASGSTPRGSRETGEERSEEGRSGAEAQKRTAEERRAATPEQGDASSGSGSRKQDDDANKGSDGDEADETNSGTGSKDSAGQKSSGGDADDEDRDEDEEEDDDPVKGMVDPKEPELPRNPPRG